MLVHLLQALLPPGLGVGALLLQLLSVTDLRQQQQQQEAKQQRLLSGCYHKNKHAGNLQSCRQAPTSVCV